MKIDIKIDNAQNAEPLLTEILDEFYDLIPNGPSLGKKAMEIIKSKDGIPRAHAEGLPTKYIISLGTSGTYPLQLTYQFAHELCHVFIDPRLTNWLIESFCECMSLIALEATGKDLKKDPQWIQNYLNYVEGIKNKRTTELGLTIDEVSTFDATEKIKILNEPYERNINFISAWKIFKLYEEDPAILHLIPYLNNTRYVDVIGEKQFVEDIQPNLTKMDSEMPKELKPIWNKLKLSLNF